MARTKKGYRNGVNVIYDTTVGLKVKISTTQLSKTVPELD